MNFIENYEISKIKPAEYNPRKIKPESAQMLAESIKGIGLVRPLLLNRNTLIAGHQRHKAMSSLGTFETCAVYRSEKISIKDEVRFNLLHNSLDLMEFPVRIKKTYRNEGFQQIQYSDIEIKGKIGSFENAVDRKNILDLFVKYGLFDTPLVLNTGQVYSMMNYLICCYILKLNPMVYVISDSKKPLLDKYLKQDYGYYNYENIPLKSSNQFMCQMNRMVDGEFNFHSKLYEGLILPEINKKQRILDFGAGKFGYVNKLKKEGYKIFGIEFFIVKGSKYDVNKIRANIDDVIRDIQKNGLYDVIILDSVLNSIVNKEIESDVLNCCNALLKPNGTIYLSCRFKDEYSSKLKLKRVSSKRVYHEYYDENNVSVKFRSGLFTAQKFHGKEEFANLVKDYFGEKYKLFAVVRTVKNRYKAVGEDSNMSYHYKYAKGIKSKQLPKEILIQSLSNEFNLQLTDSLTVNRHSEILKVMDNYL